MNHPTIAAWALAYGRGAAQHLINTCKGVSRNTIYKAVDGTPIKSGEAAIKLSDATGVPLRQVIRPNEHLREDT